MRTSGHGVLVFRLVFIACAVVLAPPGYTAEDDDGSQNELTPGKTDQESPDDLPDDAISKDYGLLYGLLPGDCDHDWSVDMADFIGLTGCITGPGTPADESCACYRLDGDLDVDIDDYRRFQTVFTHGERFSITISEDADDGTEVDRADWHENGYDGVDANLMGTGDGEVYEVGLRFQTPELFAGDRFMYARLVLPAKDDGKVTSEVSLQIVGIDKDGVAPFLQKRPSQLPKTSASASWHMDGNWPEPTEDEQCTPLLRYSPDIAPIINEILARPEWGQGEDGKTLGLVIENTGGATRNYLALADYRSVSQEDCPGVVAPQLELYRTLRSTMVGKELLGRPTDNSVTLNAYALLPMEAYVEYGTAPGQYVAQTPAVVYAARTPIEPVIGGLSPDTRYYYRLRYRQPGLGAFLAGEQGTFHTQRAPTSTFRFAVQSDSHLYWYIRENDEQSKELYRISLLNALAGAPDFLISLGDTFYAASFRGRDILDYEDAVKRHLDQRPYLDMVCHSAPFFFAIGNHDGEVGWALNGTANCMPVWATMARKLLYPLPVNGAFYSGNQQYDPLVGYRENYYAWQWGNALFVVLDPFWNTIARPHDLRESPGTNDNWDWTLGQTQYDWLSETLASSTATFKFVFAHHVAGGVNTYARGGIEAASHALGGTGSFEWGGESLSGVYEFDAHRPGWGVPVHQLMAENDVTVFFHGHDHVFVKQELDGVVYQECPMPSDIDYDDGLYVNGGYVYGDKVNNSGNLRVTVGPTTVTVDYIRAYLPGDGPNGDIAYSYTISAK